TYKSKLKKNDVRVISARENISDDASGILMEAVLEGMAEYYSAELSQKIKRGMDINAQKGLCTGGNVALGYIVDENKQFQVDPLNAPIVNKIFEMYASGNTMAEIIRYLNSQHIKTSYGNEFNKNSINRILRNKRYIGIYTYKGSEFPNVIPQIISDSLFYEVQEMMDKKKKAPARAKATVNYILSTKLFCGHCKSAMTGISGTSSTGKKHYYYQCVTNRRDKSCKKKTVNKEYIEDLVVTETRNLLTKENIKKIASEVVRLCEKEKNNDNIKRLNKLLKDNQKAMENLLKALEQGQATDIILERITQKKKECEEIAQQILIENVQNPVPTINEVRFFMEQFRNGDINDIKYRQALIDTFVNKIYLYDDRMTVLYNVQDSHSDVTIDEISSSTVGLVEMIVLYPNTFSSTLDCL
ncbi:MAG: recombinase family protein, partial [Oscillospiraceae bacterium]